MRFVRFGILTVVCAFVARCGGGGSPTSATPTIAQVAGVWQSIERSTSVTTTECVGQTTLAAGAQTSNDTIQVSQTGATLSVTSSNNATGAQTQWTGTAGASSIALTWQSCNLCAIHGFRCADGELRDVVPEAASVNGTVSGNTISGTEADTYNTFLAGTTIAEGIVTVNASFTATKQ